MGKNNSSVIGRVIWVCVEIFGQSFRSLWDDTESFHLL